MTNKTKRTANLLNSSSLFVLGTASVLLGSGPAQAFDANSLPTGGNVTGGSASIATSGNTLTVNQASNRAIIDWRNFDIGANAQANFVQPGTSSIAVNRVNGSTDPSRIDGGLHANGQVWVLNPNGVFFGKTARVDAAGVVATTANINDKAFMAGSNKLQMTGGDSGQVVNEGHISVGEGGLAAFVAPSVRNSGTIRARLGKVTLAAGDTYTLDLAGDRLVEIGLGSNKAVVDQSGKIVNAGGVIEISAKAASQVVDAVINISGVTDASSVRTVGGKIILGGDVINVASTAKTSADGTTGGQITAIADKTGNYAGSWSAQGTTGDGGQIETSGATIHIDNKIAVNTKSATGKTGSWTLDPNDLTVQAGSGGSISSGVNDDAQSTVGADTVVAALASTNVILQAKNSITVNSAIDASANSVAHNLTLVDQDSGGLTVNLNAAITLKSGGVLSGQATVVNLTNGALIQNGNDVALANSVINLNGGVYAAGATLTKSGLSLIGANGAEIDVNPGLNQLNAITIGGGTNGVTVSGLVIRGEITGSYLDYAFGSGISRGVAVVNGATNFTITGNDIRNVRNGILIDGRNTGSVTGNTIDNTKGAISVQYTDGGAGNSQGYAITISGNHQATAGNEWGLNTHLNGFWNGTTIVSNPGGAASAGVQTALLANSAANGGWTVQDQAYTSSNRTAVTVANTGSDGNQGSGRSPLATISAGINAVVAGGTVNVLNGTYVVPSGGANYISIGKSLNLIGQSEAGVIIDARNASSYGLRIIGGTDGVDLENFTLWGVTASGGYGIKAENTTNLSIDNVTSKGAFKAQFDFNGVRGATLDYLTADGRAVVPGVGGSQAGAAIAITDSQDLTLTHSSTQGGSYGGVGIYQSNKPSGYSYQAKNITIASSNSFAEANPVYMEDESATNNFGTVTVAGFGYAAHNNANAADLFTYFQNSAQGAIDVLDSVGAISTGSVEGWTGTAGNNTFTVGYSTGSHAMSIQSAVNAASSGATINVNAGTYNQALDIEKNLDLIGAGAGLTIIKPTSLFDTHTGHKYDTDVKTAVFVNGASDVNISGVTIDGGTLGANAVVFWNNASGSINGSNIYNETALNGGQTGQGLAVDATGANTATLLVNNVNFQGFNKNAIDAVNGDGATINGGNIDLTVQGSTFTGAGNTSTIAQNGILVWERAGGTVDLTADHDTFSALSFNDPDTATAAGVLIYGVQHGTVTVKNSTFGGNVQEYIATTGGSPHEVDATTGNTFGGVSASSATLDQLYAIEDKLTDGTDDSSNGLVRLVAGHVYATAAKDNLQAAIDVATNGDTVNVQAGTYNQALDIEKNLDLIGAGAGQTTIKPTTLLTTGVGHKYDSNVKTAVFVNGASDVNISGVTIDANNLGANAVVFWNNASGSISNALIENAMPFSGAQTGQGLAVDAAGGHATDLTLNGVQFVNWNKNAIDAVNGDGATTGGGNITLTVNGGSFTGQGPTSANEQNGIVLWERAGGTINATVDGATFSNIDYTGGDNNATGILLYGSTTGSLTVKNSTFDSSVQKYIGTDGGTSVEVDATSGNTFNGVAQSGATLDQFFNIEDRLVDGVDNAGNSLVRLKAGQVYVTAAKGSIQNGVSAAKTGNTVNVQAGTYAGGIAINTSGITLQGQSSTVINGSGSGNAITINGDNVTVRDLEIDIDPGANQLNGVGISGSADHATVTGLTIRGEIPDTGNHSYLDYVFGAGISRGVAVANGATNFTITGNDIRNVRNGILIDGRNTGSVTGNTIDNTKGAISVQYTDGGAGNSQGYAITISGNHQATAGNEWGLNTHLNGFWNGTSIVSNPGGAASAGVQTALLANSAANDGWTVQDQAYTSSNRTAVTVAATGSSDSNQGSLRSPLASIQAGINAVVSGGTVNVNNGIYTVVGGNYINVNKSLNLVGQSENGVIIDARNASTYGLRVTAHDGPVSLSDFTLYGVTATNGYGLKAEATQGLILADITSRGAAKSEFDLNGVIGGTLTNLDANGAAVSGGAQTAGNGISLTDSQNITLTGVTTENNAWGGLALYQSNSPTGYPTQETGITVDGSNTFTEANGIYAQDQSSTNNFGTINLSGQGIQYVSTVPTGGSDGTYTYFQKTQQGAINQAATGATGTVQGYAGDSVNGNNTFTVGTSTGGTALSVNAALNASTTGGIIDVLSGTYAENVAIIAPRTVTFDGATLNSLSVLSGGGGSTLSGSVKAGSVTAVGDIALGGDLSLDTSAAGGTIALANVDGAHDLTLNAGAGVVLTGGLGATTRLGTVDITADLIGLGATNRAASFDFNGDAVLSAASTTVDSQSATPGNITFSGDISGTTDGGQSLTLAVGSGTATLGGLGGTTRLGAVAIGGATRLTGGTYKAGSFNFGGALTLTAALTTIDSTQSATAAGNITFGGNIFGTTDGGQSLTLTAGSGTGAKSANGDINVNNAGTNAARLGNLTISGDDFTALTVDLANSFTSHLTGNQVFAADTLNAGGSVSSQAGGDISGHIVAGGDVSLNTPGTVSGNISGDDVAVSGGSVNGVTLAAANNLTVTSGSVSGSTLSGSNITANVTGNFNAVVRATNSAAVTANTIGGTFNSPTVSLTGQTVNGQVTANILNVDAQQGTITGSFTAGDVAQSLRLNGQVTGVQGQQLVVEGFALPAGTRIAANGQLILPAGTVLGLLSPGGGTPRVIMVQSVQELGELLDQGYVAIVIDLTGRKKAVKVASN